MNLRPSLTRLFSRPTFSGRTLLLLSLALMAATLGVVRYTRAASGAAVSLITINTPYSENFNTLASTGTSSTLPTGWAFTESLANANTLYTAGNGGGNAGDTYSFGATSNSDRALGMLQSGSLVSTIGACFTNNTGATITGLQIDYVGEQWRLGTAGRTDQIDFQYSLDATTLANGTWTDVNSLDFTSPETTTAGAKNGNSAANRTAKTATISSLNIPNGATFFIRWTDFNATNADDGLAVDDFSLTPQGAGPVTPTLSINDVVKAEGDSGTTTFSFQVNLTAPAGASGVTFDIATQDNTATTLNNDYIPKSQMGVSIPAGSSSYTFDVTVNGDTTVEANETFFVNVTNVVGATVSDGQGQGTINNDDVTLTAIHDIQGPGVSSPIVGASVTTRGIVTGIKSNGFFIQEPDATVDADPNTSEGIFIFTGGAPPAAVVVGNSVQVTGTVTEFVPSADPLQPPLTELTSPIVTLLSTGNPLPTPIVLTATFPDPAGTFDQLERVEGMRVSVASLTVVAPTDGNVTESSATSTSTGLFFGVVTGVARPFREPGIQAPDPAPTGTIPPIPRFDNNPERIRVDNGLVGTPVLNVGTGAIVTNLVGPLDYTQRNYTLLYEGAPMATGGPTATAVSTPSAAEFTVGSYNLERFFDNINDSNGAATLTLTAYNNRLNKASLAIRENLKFPDILGIVEVEHLTALEALANKINSDAIAAGQPNPLYKAYLVNGNDVGGINVGFLVKDNGRVTVNSVTQFGKTTTFINPDSSTSILNDRPPLLLDATINYAGGATVPLTVIVNHLRSLNGADDPSPGSNGWPTEGARVRAKRQEQAKFLANLVQARQTSNPNEKIILVGDFNAFEFNDGLGDSIATILGTPPPDNQTAVTGDGADLVNPDLSVLLEATPTQRYSFTFDGNAQSLDHILINQALITMTATQRAEHARINADFPEVDRNDANSPRRLSDHDPVVGYFSLPLPTLSVNDVSIIEGNTGTKNLKFTVTATGALSAPPSVDFAVSSGSATVGMDLPLTTGTVVFTNGSNTAMFEIPINGDTDIEPNEQFTVMLSNPQNATIDDGIGTGTIEDDDFAKQMIVKVSDPIVCTGDNNTLGVTAEMTNPNPVNGNFTFEATLPAQLTGVPGTCVTTGGTCTVNPGSVVVTGVMRPNETIQVAYKVLVAPGTPQGTNLCIDSKFMLAGNLMATVQACTQLNCLGARITVSDQKPGSLLVFPYYTAKASQQSDTRLTISNMGTAQTFVHLFLIDGATCQPSDFFLCLTPNASFSFRASEYDPETTGWMLAVAVDAQGRPVRNNSLVGNAFVREGGYVDNYGAESFAANSAAVASLNPDGTATLFFDGASYDAVPRQLTAELQSPVSTPGQRIVTVGLRGNLNQSQVTGAAQIGTGLVINGNETPVGSFVGFLSGNCQAIGTISTAAPRVPGGMNQVIPNGQSGTLLLNVGGAVGIVMTPRNNVWSGIRTLHKTAVTNTTLTIPIFPPNC